MVYLDTPNEWRELRLYRVRGQEIQVEKIIHREDAGRERAILTCADTGPNEPGPTPTPD